MEPRRLSPSFWLILLVSTFNSQPLTAQDTADDDYFPTELNSNVEEPSIALPERKTHKNFRLASKAVRKASGDKLVQLVNEAVDTTSRRLLSTDKHTPWQIMHALLGLREDFQIELSTVAVFFNPTPIDMGLEITRLLVDETGELEALLDEVEGINESGEQEPVD